MPPSQTEPDPCGKNQERDRRESLRVPTPGITLFRRANHDNAPILHFSLHADAFKMMMKKGSPTDAVRDIETGELLCDGELSTDRPINTMGSVDGKQI